MTKLVISTQTRNLIPYYLTTFAMASALASVFALVAEFKNELGFSSFEIGVIISCGYAASFVSSIVLAPLADRGQAPLLLRFGVLLGAAALLILGVGTELWQFILGRALLGFALGAAGPAVRRTIILSDPDNFGRNLGRIGTADIAGFVVGPAIAIVFNLIGDFHTPFLAIAVVLICILPTIWRAQADQGRRGARYENPILLLKERKVLGALCMVAAYWVFIGAFEPVWVMELDARGAEQWQIGLALTLICFPIAFLAPIGGTMAQKYGSRLWSMGLIIGCSLIAISFGFVPGLIPLIAITFVDACFEGMGFTATPMMVSEAVSEERQASAQGLLVSVSVAIAAVATLAFTWLYGATDDTTTWLAISVTMLVFGGLGWILSKPSHLELNKEDNN
tara:strand:- start:1950 stop:3131 length:1182 start_codon:yes stop_codon:yes gene_type:complete